MADRFSLRTKLVAAVLVLVTVALAVMELATVTAARHYLLERLDGSLALISAQVQAQIERGDGQMTIALPRPATSAGVRLPSPYLLETVYPNGQVHPWIPEVLPANPPVLTARQLERHDTFTVTTASSGDQAGAHWRVRVLGDRQGDFFVVAATMSDVEGPVRQLVTMLLIAGLVVVVAMAVVGVWLVRTSLRPLVEIEGAAVAIAGGDLTRRVRDRGTRTEVGRLGHAFNVMLERIEQAFAARASSEAAARSSEVRARHSEDRMRQFVADASHELRTPLTTIRGFAELYRQTTPADPGASARLVRRIEDEAARMGLLVEDLLLLARLDERRPFASRPVDLTVLAADAVEDARAIAPDRRVGFERTGSGQYVVTGDEERLRQVIRNLVTNALTHTPPDASVTVRLACAADRVMLEVADNGPGLGPEQQRRVFERFYRADPSRSRRNGPAGTGLGLAIVAAIVAAHDGTVEVESTPGTGATFRVILPVAPRTSAPESAPAGAAEEPAPEPGAAFPPEGALGQMVTQDLEAGDAR